MTCSTLGERAAGSPTQTNQVSLQHLHRMPAVCRCSICKHVRGQHIDRPIACVQTLPFAWCVEEATCLSACVCVLVSNRNNTQYNDEKKQFRIDDCQMNLNHQKIKPSQATMNSFCWAEAPIQIARMTLTIKLDRNWSSFQLANSAPLLSVTDRAIAPSAIMLLIVMHHVYIDLSLQSHVLRLRRVQGMCRH